MATQAMGRIGLVAAVAVTVTVAGCGFIGIRRDDVGADALGDTAGPGDVEYVVTARTGTSGKAGTDASGGVWARIGGSLGATGFFELDNGADNFRRGAVERFRVSGRTSGIGNVGIPVFIEMRLHKDARGKDGWYYTGVTVDYLVRGRRVHTSQFSREGWLDDKLGVTGTQVLIWEDDLSEQDEVVYTSSEVVATPSWCFDNRENPTDVPLVLDDEFVLTQSQWDQFVKSKTKSNEFSLGAGVTIKKVGLSAGYSRKTTTGREQTTGRSQTTVARKAIRRPLTVKAHTLMLYKASVTMDVEKKEWRMGGKILARYAPKPQTLVFKYQYPKVIRRGESMDPQTEAEIQRAKAMLNK